MEEIYITWAFLHCASNVLSLSSESKFARGRPIIPFLVPVIFLVSLMRERRNHICVKTKINQHEQRTFFLMCVPIQLVYVLTFSKCKLLLHASYICSASVDQRLRIIRPCYCLPSSGGNQSSSQSKPFVLACTLSLFLNFEILEETKITTAHIGMSQRKMEVIYSCCKQTAKLNIYHLENNHSVLSYMSVLSIREGKIAEFELCQFCHD